MRALTRFRFPLLALGLALAFGCSAKSPNSPTAPPSNPVPPPQVVSVNFTITTSRSELAVNGTEPATLTIRAFRADNGAPITDRVVVTTSLGSLGSVGGPQTVTLDLTNGVATIPLFPGATIGTAVVRANIESTTVSSTVNVVIREPNVATFFLSSVSPNTGSPQGGETVTILGGGIVPPLRVTFNGVAAVVVSSSATQIRVITPPLLGGLNPGETQAVPVAVTIHLNEADQATDTLASGFIYANGGGGGTLQPSVFSVTPASGPNEGGTQVTINGDGFEAPVQVKFGTGTSDANFNGAEAQILSVSRTRIVVLSPTTTCGTCAPPTPNLLASILIKNQNTGRFTVASSAFRYGSQILITSIGPGEGPASGGTLVTIFGQGFDDPVAVSMGQHAQQVLSASGTEIVVRTVGIELTSCTDVSGATSVTNINSGQTATGPVFVYRAPRIVITGINPRSGGQAGGTGVTITGQGFAPPVIVKFRAGGTLFTAASGAVTSTTISATSPGIPNSAFPTEPCDVDNDGIIGERYVGVSADIIVESPTTTCTDTLEGAFLYNPADVTCRGD